MNITMYTAPDDRVIIMLIYVYCMIATFVYKLLKVALRVTFIIYASLIYI